MRRGEGDVVWSTAALWRVGSRSESRHVWCTNESPPHPSFFKHTHMHLPRTPKACQTSSSVCEPRVSLSGFTFHFPPSPAHVTLPLSFTFFSPPFPPPRSVSNARFHTYPPSAKTLKSRERGRGETAGVLIEFACRGACTCV